MSIKIKLLTVSSWAVLLLLVISLLTNPIGQAQSPVSPLVIIHGYPDALTDPPQVHIRLSVIDSETGQSIKGLLSDNFRVIEAGKSIQDLSVTRESAGLAIVAVIDRRALSFPGDPRMQAGIRLLKDLISRLSVTGAPHDDMIALVGIMKDDLLQPEVPFTFNPVDLNLINNALTIMEGEVGGYEGIDIAAEINDSGELEVLEVYPGGPAAKAGLLVGDRILRIDNVPVTGSTFREIADLICGEAGTEAKLLVSREGMPGPFEITVVRARTVAQAGLGASVQLDADGRLEIVRVYKDLPMDRAQISAGDRILKVDNIAVNRDTYQQAVELLHGSPGTKVTLLILPKKGADPYEVTLTRLPVTICGRISHASPMPYEGIEEALRLLNANPDVMVRRALDRRRKIIVVFTGSIAEQYIDAARENYILSIANRSDVSIYTIGIGWPDGGLAGAAHLRRIATYSGGAFMKCADEDTYQQVLKLFDRLMTQRQQYLITYRSQQPKGIYPLQITVDTEIGSVEKNTVLFSPLLPPKIFLTSPSGGHIYTDTTVISLSVQVEPTDGITRTITEVHYFANGIYIGKSNAPNSIFERDLSDIPALMGAQNVILLAEAEDPYLGIRLQSPPVIIRFVPSKQGSISTGSVDYQLEASYYVLLVLLVIAVIGEIALYLLLIRTRHQAAQRIVTETTGVFKGMTRRLGATPPAAAKLIVVKGANVGREIPLSAPVTKIARDPHFGDFALYDEYVSNPHFSVHQEQTQFYIVDEGSTNGTRMNGMPIPPHTRILLQPDAIIEAGMTRLQFKQVGGTTRQVQQPGIPAAPSAPSYPDSVPPTQQSPPYSTDPNPVPPTTPGGPTKKVS